MSLEKKYDTFYLWACVRKNDEYTYICIGYAKNN